MKGIKRQKPKGGNCMKKKTLSLFFIFLAVFADDEPLYAVEQKTKLGTVVFYIYGIRKAIKDNIKFNRPVTDTDKHYIEIKDKRTDAVIGQCITSTKGPGETLFTSNHVLAILSPHICAVASQLRNDGKLTPKKKKIPSPCTLL